MPWKKILDPILGGKTYLWFCTWTLHMVLGAMVFVPCYFVDLIKGTMVMFKSRVNGLSFMDDSACIYMYYNIERNIMKKSI